MQELREGIRLADRYALIKRIATGGMAELWLAADDRSGSNVVLKFPSEALLATAGQRELFRKEWQTASRLMHAHIVRVFEYHDDERPFYAQQHIDGPDIGALHAEPLDNLLGPIGLVADALRYAHGKGVVHRDVTAQNILLDQRGAPYLIDFGLTGARTGGTPAALSPQQQAGEAPAAADDIYALGVLLHELLTGQPPGDLSQGLRRPTGEAIPNAINRLVVRMLDADAGRRPSAEDVHEALAKAGFPARAARLPDRYRSADAPTEVRIESVSPQARRPAAEAPQGVPSRDARGMSPKTVYGALAVLIAVLVGVTFLLPSAVERSEPESAAETVAPLDPEAEEPDVPPTPEDGMRVFFLGWMGMVVGCVSGETPITPDPLVDPDPDHDPGLVGLWAVERPTNAQFWAEFYRLDADGSVTLEESTVGDCSGLGGCDVGRVFHCGPTMDCYDWNDSCVFGDTWYSLSPLHLVILGECTGGVTREILIGFQRDDEGELVNAALLGVDNDPGWTFQPITPLFHKCPEGPPSNCGADTWPF